MSQRGQREILNRPDGRGVCVENVVKLLNGYCLGRDESGQQTDCTAMFNYRGGRLTLF